MCSTKPSMGDFRQFLFEDGNHPLSGSFGKSRGCAARKQEAFELARPLTPTSRRRHKPRVSEREGAHVHNNDLTARESCYDLAVAAAAAAAAAVTADTKAPAPSRSDARS